MRRGLGGDEAHSPDPSLTSIAAGAGVTRRPKSHQICRQKQVVSMLRGATTWRKHPVLSRNPWILGPLPPYHLTGSCSHSHSRSWCPLLRPSSLLACPLPPPRPRRLSSRLYLWTGLQRAREQPVPSLPAAACAALWCAQRWRDGSFPRSCHRPLPPDPVYFFFHLWRLDPPRPCLTLLSRLAWLPTHLAVGRAVVAALPCRPCVAALWLGGRLVGGVGGGAFPDRLWLGGRE